MAKAVLVALAAGMFSLSGMAKDAAATVTFSLVWQATTGAGVTGSNTITGVIGDVLTLGIQMSTNQTLAGHSVSLNFDMDLGNELNLFNPAGGAEWSGTSYGATGMAGTYSPLVLGLGPPTAVESTGSNAGRINSYESGKTPTGAFLPTGTYTIGTARFVMVGYGVDGPDIFVGLFNLGLDDVIDNLNTVIPPSGLVFGNATVNTGDPVPEPGTAALIGLGLVGLAAMRRKAS